MANLISALVNRVNGARPIDPPGIMLVDQATRVVDDLRAEWHTATAQSNA